MIADTKSRSYRRLCAVLLLGPLPTRIVAQYRPPYEPPAVAGLGQHTEHSVKDFGRFSVEREVQDNRNFPTWGPLIERRTTLAWRDASRTTTVSFRNEGSTVALSLSVEKGKTNCLMFLGSSPANNEPVDERRWDAIRRGVGKELRSCTLLTAEDRKTINADMEASRSDYRAAVSYWRSVALELFGS